MTWHSMHVHYHDDQNQLVHKAIQPLFQALPPAVSGAFFLRHWRRGPHVRVNVRCAEETLINTVRPLVDDIIGGYLSVRPSGGRVNAVTESAAHDRLAELERDNGPRQPWRRDNSIHDEPFEDRADTLGGADAAALLIDFYVGTNELAFDMTSSGTDRTALITSAYDLMIATAHTFARGGITDGFVSFRSHAEAFLMGYPEGRGNRMAWDDHYRRHAARLITRTRTIIAALDDSAVAAPIPRRWLDTVRPYHARAAALIACRKLTMDPESQRLGGDDRHGVTAIAERSSFHQRLLANPNMAAIRGADWFVRYRVALNYLYLHLTRVGVTPGERFLLCHLAANAVEECYGVSALDLVDAAGKAEP